MWYVARGEKFKDGDKRQQHHSWDEHWWVYRCMTLVSIVEISVRMVAASRLERGVIKADAVAMKRRMFWMATILRDCCFGRCEKA